MLSSDIQHMAETYALKAKKSELALFNRALLGDSPSNFANDMFPLDPLHSLCIKH